MRGAIHQLVPVLSRGDAIGSSVLLFQGLLRGAGYASDVFAQLADRRVAGSARPAACLPGAVGQDDATVYHLSTGSPAAAMFEQLRSPRIIYYHNITPASYVEDRSAVQGFGLRWGRADLDVLAPVVDLAMAASRYSAGELRAAGARRVAVVPLPVDLARLRPRPARAPQRPTLLFVGRFAPHKRQDELIRVLAALRGTHAPEAQLVLAGAAGSSDYVARLRAFATALGVGDAVRIHDRLTSDRDLGELYATASLFVCASEHEGFCAPLLEAMAFSLPVLAYDAGAVAETVADAGIVTPSRNPLEWADLAWDLLRDARRREELVARGAQRLQGFDHAHVGDALQRALAELG